FGAPASNASRSDAGWAQKQENGEAPAPQKPIINNDKVGRNDPCPCGSGKKYKKCCGK
ncbi:MAG TPA: SEC-C metal-binding domain-containing protein, partial [Candidatus Omnitrophota bacterium]|nr:SEC-C metal-binding domain-containing protein [Candidatus Omnitrophota bacterium]